LVVTGPEIVSVQAVAEASGGASGVPSVSPALRGRPFSATRRGAPRSSARRRWTSSACATGSRAGSRTAAAALGKPTHFESTDGRF
jgi:hypothetical protein